MPYFKDQTGSLHFLSNEDMVNNGERFLPVGVIPITDNEAIAIENPVKPLADVKKEKIASLAALRDAATTAPVVVGGKTLSAELYIQTGMKRLGDRLRRGKPTTLQAILDVNGNPITPVNQALLDAYEDAVAANTEASWNHYGQLVAQVNAALDSTAVGAIVW